MAEGWNINPNLKVERCKSSHNQADGERPETGGRYFEEDRGGIKGDIDPEIPDRLDMRVTQQLRAVFLRSFHTEEQLAHLS